MDEHGPGEEEIAAGPSAVDATFGAFRGERIVAVDEERREARRRRANHLARKHAANQG